MRVLLDTNILIHREAATVVRQDIGTLFFWLDKLGSQKCVHPAGVLEIQKHKDAKVRAAFAAKLRSYHELKTIAPTAPAIGAIGASDRTDTIDSLVSFYAPSHSNMIETAKSCSGVCP